MSSLSQRIMISIPQACEVVHDTLYLLCSPNSVSQQVPALGAVLQDILSRFQIWGSNIEALQQFDHTTSLEHRLRDNPELKKLFLDRLHDLREDLDDLHNSIREADISLLASVKNITHSAQHDSASNDEAEVVTDIRALLRAASEDVAALFKLSIAARKITARDRYARAVATVHPSQVVDENDEAESIGDQFRKLRSRDLQWLRERLAKANNARRRFLTYSTDHQARTVEGESVVYSVESADSRNEVEVDSVSANSLTSTAVASGLEKSKPFLERGRSDDGTTSESSQASSATETSSDAILSVVDLEEVRNGQDVFVCPYCKLKLMIKSQASWRTHVLSDLKAYMCTAATCGLHMFADSHAWLEHEVSEHLAAAICPYCGYRALDDSELTLGRHMLAAHSSTVGKDQVEDLAKASVHRPDSISTSICPFCDWDAKIHHVDKRQQAKEATYVSMHRYRRHVGSHLEQVALAVIDARHAYKNEEIEEAGNDYGEAHSVKKTEITIQTDAASSVGIKISDCVQASQALSDTIEILKDQSEHIQEMETQLKELRNVLLELSKATDDFTEFSDIGMPLYHCATACREVNALIHRSAAGNTESQVGVQDRGTLRYVGGVQDFMNRLIQYKVTFQVALGARNLRTSEVTTGVVHEYHNLVKDAEASLQRSLNRLGEQSQNLDFLSQQTGSTETIQDLSPSMGDFEHLKESQANTKHLTGGLQQQLGIVQDRMYPTTRIGFKETEEEQTILRRCLELCEQAADAARNARTTSIVDVTGDINSQQLIVSTLGDLFSARRVMAGEGSLQLLGTMSYSSLVDLSARHDNDILAHGGVPEDMTDKQFESHYGAGFTLGG